MNKIKKFLFEYTDKRQLLRIDLIIIMVMLVLLMILIVLIAFQI